MGLKQGGHVEALGDGKWRRTNKQSAPANAGADEFADLLSAERG